MKNSLKNNIKFDKYLITEMDISRIIGYSIFDKTNECTSVVTSFDINYNTAEYDYKYMIESIINFPSLEFEVIATIYDSGVKTRDVFIKIKDENSFIKIKNNQIIGEVKNSYLSNKNESFIIVNKENDKLFKDINCTIEIIKKEIFKRKIGIV